MDFDGWHAPHVRVVNLESGAHVRRIQRGASCKVAHLSPQIQTDWLDGTSWPFYGGLVYAHVINSPQESLFPPSPPMHTAPLKIGSLYVFTISPLRQWVTALGFPYWLRSATDPARFTCTLRPEYKTHPQSHRQLAAHIFSRRENASEDAGAAPSAFRRNADFSPSKRSDEGKVINASVFPFSRA